MTMQNHNGNNESILSGLDNFDFSICTDDTSTLITQLQVTPTIYWEFSKRLEEIKGYVADLKLKSRVKESLISKEIRRTDFKISEAKLDRLIFENEEYLVLQEKLNQLKVIEGKLSAFVRGLEQRQSIMLSILHFMRQELRQQTF